MPYWIMTWVYPITSTSQTVKHKIKSSYESYFSHWISYRDVQEISFLIMNGWDIELKTDKAIKIILFVLSPFIAMLYSLRRVNTKSSYIIFFLFCVFFGISFSVPESKSESNEYDGSHYRSVFEAYKYISEKEYIDGLNQFLSFQGKKDYYLETVSFYLSRLTDNYHFLFMVFAIVFAYFGLKTLRFFTSENKYDNSFTSLILLYLFLNIQIFNINGGRFWTAAWVAIYCIFQIFRNGNKRYFLLAFTTPFFHGAYWIFIAIILFAYLSKQNHKIWKILFLASFLVSNISVEVVRQFIDSLPPSLSGMAQSYTDPETIERRSAAGSGFYWVAEIFRITVRIYMNYMVWLFIKNSFQITSNSKTKYLYPFLLIWMTFVNFTMPIPSLGGRFMAMSYPIIAYIWLVNFYNVKYTKVLYAMPFIFLFSFYRTVLHYNKVLDPSFFVSSPLYLVYKYLIAA